MRQFATLRRILSIAVILGVLLAYNVPSAFAVPPLPADFWGYVIIDGIPAPVGTVVQATVNGVAFQTATTAGSGGQSLYILSVNGDDPSTTAVEGGSDGQAITFRVGGVSVSQTETWRSGTNTHFDLARVTVTPASLLSASPNAVIVGATTDVVIVGEATHFNATSIVSFGSGVTVNSVVAASATQLTANVTVAADATAGERTIAVTTGAETANSAGLFYILGPNVTVSLPSSTAATGASVTIPVQLPANNADPGILAYRFQVSADPTVLVFTGVDVANTLSANWALEEQHATPGQIVVSGYGTAALVGSGVLVKLTANVVGSAGAATALTFGSLRLNEGLPASTPVNGSFTAGELAISGKVVLAGSTTAVDGAALVLSGGAGGSTVSAADGGYRLPVSAVGSYVLTPGKVRYSGAAISALDAAWVAQCDVGKRQATDCPATRADVSANGEVTVYDAALIARYVVGLTTEPSSLTGEWSFNPVSRSYASLQTNQVDQDFAATLAGDVNGSWTQAGGLNAALLPAEIGKPDNTSDEGVISAPVLLTVEAEDIVAYELLVRYDPAVLQIRDFDKQNTLTEQWPLVWNEVEPGKVLVAAYGVDPLAGQGDLVRLQFATVDPNQTLDDALSSLDVQIKINEYTLPSQGTRLHLPIVQR